MNPHLNYETHVFDGAISEDFGEWAIRHRLYARGTGFGSHFFDLYKSRAPLTEGLIAIIAFDKKKPVGITLIERAHEVIQAETVVWHGLQANKRQKQDWSFHRLGRVGVYVVPSYRSKGLGAALMRKAEEARLLECTGLDLPAKDLVCLSAGQQAYTTALILAAYHDHGTTVKLLLDHGADTGLTDNFGNTALDWTGHMQHITTGEIIRQHDAEKQSCIAARMEL